MKLTLTILIILSGFPGFFNKDFKFIEATSQEWIGGTRDSGKGVNYKITVQTRTNSDKLKFEEIWIKNKLCRYRMYNLSIKKFGNNFEKNDTILFTATIKADNSDSNYGKDKQLPFEYNAETIIGYKLKNKMKYKPFDDINLLKPLYYK